MKKLPLFLFCSLLLLVAACKRRDEEAIPVKTTEYYYFKFNFGGQAQDLNTTVADYSALHTYEIGSHMRTDSGVVGLSFAWPADDTVKESDVLGLAGKTLYFNAAAPIKPTLTYYKDVAVTWYSQLTPDPAYNVSITSVNFFKRDSAFGRSLRTYLITGTCKAAMFQYPDTVIISDASFSMVFGMKDL